MRTASNALGSVMAQAVAACVAHVNAGGLPFVGVVVNADGEVASEFGVNRVVETGDQSAHAEVVAMRDAMTSGGLTTLAGYALLATGEPCGLCYRYAIDRGVEAIHVAVNRDEAAGFGFDYRPSYRMFGIDNVVREALFRPLPVEHGTEPFTRYLQLHLPGQATARPTNLSKGTPS